jgi:hypothetical protein
MASSSLGSGSGARARSTIQIGPTTRAKPATIFATERKRIHRQRQLLADRGLEIDPSPGFRQRVHPGIVLKFRIRGEQHLHRLHYRRDELGQAPATNRAHLPLQPAMPEKPILARPLEDPAHGQRAIEGNLESLEERIGGWEFSGGLDGAVAELANVNL